MKLRSTRGSVTFFSAPLYPDASGGPSISMPLPVQFSTTMSSTTERQFMSTRQLRRLPRPPPSMRKPDSRTGSPAPYCVRGLPSAFSSVADTKNPGPSMSLASRTTVRLRDDPT